jgi:hypothetical protein
MGPIRFTGAQLDAIIAAARPLAVASRDAFLLDLTAALQGIKDPGDGDVARAIRAVQRKHFDPTDTDERQEPNYGHDTDTKEGCLSCASRRSPV